MYGIVPSISQRSGLTAKARRQEGQRLQRGTDQPDQLHEKPGQIQRQFRQRRKYQAAVRETIQQLGAAGGLSQEADPVTTDLSKH